MDHVDMKLEVVVIPVADVDRAKAFYEQLGFRLDVDYPLDPTYRVVHFTPPGSGASIAFGEGVTEAAPGSVDGLMLVVDDIVAAHAELTAKGVKVSEIFHDETGLFRHAGTTARVAGVQPERRSYGSFLSFEDPDGNRWTIQEITERIPGR
jgi:catechol 2,3-dioxygenase-like lactoylglutathione lyase family enzyme